MASSGTDFYIDQEDYIAQLLALRDFVDAWATEVESGRGGFADLPGRLADIDSLISGLTPTNAKTALWLVRVAANGNDHEYVEPSAGQAADTFKTKKNAVDASEDFLDRKVLQAVMGDEGAAYTYTGSLITEITTTSGYKITYSYNADNSMNEVKFYDTDGTSFLFKFTYNYTGGNLTSRTRSEVE